MRGDVLGNGCRYVTYKGDDIVILPNWENSPGLLLTRIYFIMLLEIKKVGP